MLSKKQFFRTNTSFGMPSGTTINDMDNKNVLNVTLDELPDQMKELVVTAVNQYQEKCLLSFSKNRDRKVIQNTLFPRVIMEGERDPVFRFSIMSCIRLSAKP